jgi:magnesium chelatase family protein
MPPGRVPGPSSAVAHPRLGCSVHATVRSAALIGADAIEVTVEASLSGGLPAIHVVGLPDAAVREARERVRSALRAIGAPLPASRVVVNLAPADVRKEGPALDLPIALALLAAQRRVPTTRLARTMAIGELGLDGQVRAVRGAVAFALLAVQAGCDTLVLPAHQVRFVSRVPNLTVVGVVDLAAAVAWAQGRSPTPVPVAVGAALECGGSGNGHGGLDLADVRANATAKRALEVAAAGGHHLLLIGAPGAGKSMLARRLPGLLPPLGDAAALEVARLHSVAGIERDPADRSPPHREPHHASSLAGVLGSVRGPGEISLAHHGVLFLDELPEFDRRTIEALRQPIESGVVVLSMARGRASLPARVQLVAAMNPCPCGFDGDAERACRCHPSDRRRYRGRLSGPMLDRFELRVIVPRVDERAPAPGERTRERSAPRERSAAVAARVAAARGLALARDGCATGALQGARLARQVLDADARALLEHARARGLLGERGLDQVRRVARTLADLGGSPHIGGDHVTEAMAYRAEPWADDPGVD